MKAYSLTTNPSVLHQTSHLINKYIAFTCIRVVDGIERQRRRRIPSGELKDHFPSDGSEHTSTSGVEEETHIRKKVQTSSADDLRKKATSKRVCFSTSPKRKPKPLSSPSKNVVLSAKQQRASPRRKSKAPLSPLKSTGEGGRAKQERVRNHSDETVSAHSVHSEGVDTQREKKHIYVPLMLHWER